MKIYAVQDSNVVDLLPKMGEDLSAEFGGQEIRCECMKICITQNDDSHDLFFSCVNTGIQNQTQVLKVKFQHF